MGEAVHPQNNETTESSVELAAKEFTYWSQTFWSWIGGIFLLTITVTNFLYGQFGFRLIPIFENSFQGLHEFAHWALDTFLLNWIVWLISRGWFELTTVLAREISWIKPQLPYIHLPEWYKDLIFISIVIERSFERAIDIVVLND